MAYYPATAFVPQFFNDAGVPLSGGTLSAFVADSTTPTPMYIDDAGTEAGLVVTLNARGEPQVSGNTVVIWLNDEITYKFILKDASGISKWTINNIADAGAQLRNDLAASGGAAMIGYGIETVADELGDLADRASALEAGIREKLTANRTYYVSTSGNNSNSGLTALLSFLTIQYAYDFVMKNIDFNGYIVTVQLVDGNYSAGLVALTAGVGQAGAGSLVFLGNITTPSNVHVTTAGDCFQSGSGHYSPAMFTLDGIKLTSTGGNGINAQGGCVIFRKMDFGPCLQFHVTAGHGAFVIQNGNDYVITGAAESHAQAGTNGTVALHGATVNILGGPYTFSYFVQATSNGNIFVNSMTFTNGAFQLGPRFLATGGGLITALGGSALDYLPGSLPGKALNGGFYDSFTIDGLIEVITTSQTVSPISRDFLLDATAGNIVITLPATTAYNAGMKFGFNRIDGTGNTVTINRSDATTLTTVAAGAYKTYRSYVSNWYQFA